MTLQSCNCSQNWCFYTHAHSSLHHMNNKELLSSSLTYLTKPTRTIWQYLRFYFSNLLPDETSYQHLPRFSIPTNVYTSFYNYCYTSFLFFTINYRLHSHLSYHTCKFVAKLLSSTCFLRTHPLWRAHTFVCRGSKKKGTTPHPQTASRNNLL